MKIITLSKHETWICTQRIVALVSYEQIIAWQSINTSDLFISNDRSMSMTSSKHVNHLKRTCPNYAIAYAAQRNISDEAIEVLNHTDNDPFTTDDGKRYTFVAVLPSIYARELLQRYHGIDPVNGRYTKDQFYAVHDDTYAILYTGSIYLYFEAHTS